MKLVASNLPTGAGNLREAIASNRSARNLASRRRRHDGEEARKAERASRTRRRKDDRELEELLRWRFRTQIAPDGRSKMPRRVRLDLFHRGADAFIGTIGTGDCRGPDGLHSIHFAITPRGFASRTGRRWRPGEAARAGLYVTRPHALECGEDGWWSSFAADRDELFTFLRTLEGIERQDRSNANVYVSEIIALPSELDAEQRRAAVARAAAPLRDRGLPIVVGMHRPDPGGDQRNFHCHIIYSLRPFERHDAYDWSFALGKEADINTPAGIAKRRREVVRAINDTLQEAGINKRYTHLSNAARGMPRAQKKMGQAQTWLHRRIDALERREAQLARACTVAANLVGTLNGARDDLAALGAKVGARLAFHQRNLARAEWILPTVLQTRLDTLHQELGREKDTNQAELDRLRPDVLLAARTQFNDYDRWRLATASTAKILLWQSAQDVAKRLSATHRRITTKMGSAAASLSLLGAVARLNKVRNVATFAQDEWLQRRATVENRLETAGADIRAAASASATNLKTVELHLAAEERRRALRRKAVFLIEFGGWSRGAAGELDVLRPDVAGPLAQKRGAASAPETAAEASHNTLKVAIVERLTSWRAVLGPQMLVSLADLPKILLPRLRDRAAAVADVGHWSDAVLRQIDRERENIAMVAADRTDGPNGNGPDAGVQDAARASAVTSYAEFLRSDAGVRFAKAGDLDVVDLDSLPEEWKRSAEAFDEEPEVRDAIDDVCETRRREELLARQRTDAAKARRQIIAQVENARVNPVYWDGRRFNVRLELLDDKLRGQAAAWADDPQLQVVYRRVRHEWKQREAAAGIIEPQSEPAALAASPPQEPGHATEPAAPAAQPGSPDEMNQFELLRRAVEAAARGASRSS